jgi:hypothetical protein
MSDAKKPPAVPSEMQHAIDDLRLMVWRLQPVGTGIGVPDQDALIPIPVNPTFRGCRVPISRSEILEVFKKVTDHLVG